MDILERLVLKNAAQRTSQHVKWTSGARLTITVDRSIARAVARSIDHRSIIARSSLAWSLDRSVAQSRYRPIARSLGRSVARSLDRSIARSLGLSVARSQGSSIDRSIARLLDPSITQSFDGSCVNQAVPVNKASVSVICRNRMVINTWRKVILTMGGPNSECK